MLVAGAGAAGGEWWEAKAGERTGLAGGARGRGEVEGGINGEAVREEMEAWAAGLRIQAGVWGLAWAMGTVGLWGDGA